MFLISQALTVDAMLAGVIGGFVLMIKLIETSSPLYRSSHNHGRYGSEEWVPPMVITFQIQYFLFA